MSLRKFSKAGVRVISSLFVLMVILSCFSLTVFADDEEEDNNQDYSYANAAAIINAKFTYVSESGTCTESVTNKMYSASALIGYSDTKVMEGKNFIFGWLISHSTLSSASYSYSFYRTGFGQGIMDYFELGSGLGQTGLDQTVYIDPLGNLARLLGGALFLVAYFFAYSVNLVYKVVIKVLLFINPFQLFSKSTKNTFLQTALAYDPGSAKDNSMTAIAEIVSRFYDALYDLSWAVVVPILIVSLLLTILVFAPGDPNKRRHSIKKFAIRIAFIGLGIPIIGILYCSCLEKLDEASDGTANSATYIVMSTFCDFEGWCRESHMATSGISYQCDSFSNYKGFILSAKSEALIRYSCLKMNAHASGVSGTFDKYKTTGNAVTTGTDKETTKSVYSAYSNMINSGDDTSKIDSDCYDMLLKYMCADTYEAATYESDDKKSITGPSTFFGHYKDYQKFEDDKTWDNGVKSATFNNYGFFVCRPDGETDGLSRLGVFNYLSTSFGKTGCTVYSTGASSALVRQSHRSVNICGSSGFMRFMYWLSGIVTLVCLGIIGYAYCLGVLMSNLKRGFTIVLNAAMGMVGNISAIAQFVTNSIIMIIEVLATFLIYSIISEVIFALPDMIVGLVIDYIT